MDIINQASFKSIFAIENLKQFFLKYGHHWEKDYLRQVKSQINAFLNCGNIAFAKATFSCDCGLVAYRPVTCKSRFCPSCAANSSTNWANALSDEFIDKKHRFILFSVHPKLEKFLFNHREIYGELSSIINKLFRNFFKYNSTVKKFKITDFGLISFIHTFGRSSNFNLHFHVILTEGGFDSKGKWHSVNFFPYQKFKDDWHNEVIKLLKRKFPLDKRIEKWQGKNPLVCPRCNKKMKLISFEHKKYGIFNYCST